MNKALSELVAEWRDKADGGESPVYALVAEELENVLNYYGVYEALYSCGCPVSEFGCQGFHGC